VEEAEVSVSLSLATEEELVKVNHAEEYIREYKDVAVI
jgi:hypothetical protein